MRYFIEFSYHGAAYHGWQIQPNAITVQEVLEKILSTSLRQTISLTGAGRTDTGVHASQMYAHFDTDLILDHTWITKWNRFAPQTIALKQIKRVKNTAHARFDALARTYQYHISLEKNVFLQDRSWIIPNQVLNLDKMQKAADLLFKYNDFTSFSKLHTDVKTNICTIKKAEWTVQNKQLLFTIQADRFLRNMVRAIVGTLVQVGMNKLTLIDFETIITQKNRQKAGMSAPAMGLFLSEIEYPNYIWL